MTPLRLLIVEDEPSDAELIVRELKKSGYDPVWQQVDTSAAFESLLAEDPPESDHFRSCVTAIRLGGSAAACA